jgi:membrane-associated phospholipid phosphatase
MAPGLPRFVQRRTDPAQRYGLRLTLAALATLLVAVPFAFLLFQVVAGGPLTRLDADVADRLNETVRGHGWLIAVLRAVSWLGWPPLLALVVTLAVAIAWRSGSTRLLAFLVATTAGGAVVSTVTKLLVDRPRPEVDHPVAEAFGASFPSGHAMGSTVVYGVVLLAFLPLVRPDRRRAATAVTAAVVLVVAASRVLLGVHFLTDVVAGIVLGAAWLIAATVVFEIWRAERGRPFSNPVDDGIEPEEGPRLESRSRVGDR